MQQWGLLYMPFRPTLFTGTLGHPFNASEIYILVTNSERPIGNMKCQQYHLHGPKQIGSTRMTCCDRKCHRAHGLDLWKSHQRGNSPLVLLVPFQAGSPL